MLWALLGGCCPIVGAPCRLSSVMGDALGAVLKCWRFVQLP